MSEPELPAGYPKEWEADVLMSDGGTARLRPITPSDRGLLVEFYTRVSPESKFLRFFAPYPRLSERDLTRFTEVDYVDRVALILTIGGRMVAIGRYDRIEGDEAEVAFLVEDSQQGRGAGQLLLEHLAQAARERGITRFTAEVLPQNRKMAQVFSDAGFKVAKQYEDGIVAVEFPILPTDTSVGVMLRREHRAEASSIRRLLTPRRVLLHGSMARVQPIADSLIGGGFSGAVIAVSTDSPQVDPEQHNPDAARPDGVQYLDTIAAVEGEIDLAVVAVEADQLAGVVIDVANKRAHGILVLVGDEASEADAQHLVGLARSYGLRALGPDALGLMNLEAGISLNASPAPLPRPGRVGIFCQSAAVGVMQLATALRTHVGVSQFVSTGTLADVTGNDVMQFWEDDEQTAVCLLSLDRIGNPRKFTRIIRRLARQKPVVVFAPSRAELANHAGVVPGLHPAPPEAIDALFRQSGVIVAERRSKMFDIAKVLARQPLPSGPRVGLVSNSGALSRQVSSNLRRHGLLAQMPRILSPQADAQDLAVQVSEALEDDECDSVLCVTVGVFDRRAGEAYAELREIAKKTSKPLIAVFIDFAALTGDSESVDGPGHLPLFDSYGDAVQALAAVTAYAHWLERDPGAVPVLETDAALAKQIVSTALAQSPAGRVLTEGETAELLSCFAITMVPRFWVTSLEEAIAAATTVGWNVVLKATAASVRGRPDLASVFRNLESDEELTDAWADLGRLVESLGLGGREDQLLAGPVIQAMAPTGVSLQLGAVEDPAFGPVISVGLDGAISELVGDLSYRVPPLTSTDAAAMVRELRAAPLLFGRTGQRPVDVSKIEELINKVAQLADALAQVASVHLTPCVASSESIWVLGAQVHVLPLAEHRDSQSRVLG